MRIIHRAHKRLALIRAAFPADRTRFEQLLVKLVAILEAAGVMPAGGRTAVARREEGGMLNGPYSLQENQL